MKNWQLRIIRYNYSMRYILGLLLIIGSNSVFSSPAEERPEQTVFILEKAQEIFGARANQVANRLDAFFATERADDEFGRSRIRLRSQFGVRERDKSDLKYQYSINLRLPSLERRFKYEQYQSEESKALSREEREREKQNRIKRGWIFNADMGVSAAIPPRLITRARVRKSFVTGTLINRFAEELTHITDESGLVEETELLSDHVFNSKLVFRFVNRKEWKVLKKDFQTNHGPTLLHQLTENDAFNYGLTMQTIIDNGIWYTSNYQLAVNYRRNLYRQWIYFDVIPGLDFPKEWSFRRTPFIQFQIEVLFGG